MADKETWARHLADGMRGSASHEEKLRRAKKMVDKLSRRKRRKAKKRGKRR